MKVHILTTRDHNLTALVPMFLGNGSRQGQYAGLEEVLSHLHVIFPI